MKISKILAIAMPITLGAVAITGTAVSLTSCAAIKDLVTIKIDKSNSQKFLDSLSKLAANKENNTKDKLEQAIKSLFNKSIHFGANSVTIGLTKDNPAKLTNVVLNIDKMLIKNVVIDKDIKDCTYDKTTRKLTFTFKPIETHISTKA